MYYYELTHKATQRKKLMPTTRKIDEFTCLCLKNQQTQQKR
jgi:hypothetical protein